VDLITHRDDRVPEEITGMFQITTNDNVSLLLYSTVERETNDWIQSLRRTINDLQNPILPLQNPILPLQNTPYDIPTAVNNNKTESPVPFAPIAPSAPLASLAFPPPLPPIQFAGASLELTEDNEENETQPLLQSLKVRERENTHACNMIYYRQMMS
jgi:hypothetical protein